MAQRVYQSGVVVIHSSLIEQRIYQSGVIVIHSEAEATPLATSISDSANNWGDALFLSFAGISSVSLSDDVNNWLDALSVSLRTPLSQALGDDADSYADDLAVSLEVASVIGISIPLADDANNWADVLVALSGVPVELTDSINNWADSLVRSSEYFISVSDSANKWKDKLSPLFPLLIEVDDQLSFSDALSVFVSGISVVELADDFTVSDALALQLDHKLTLADNANNWKSSIETLLTLQLAIADSTDNLDDELVVNVINELTALLGDSANFWNDSILNELISRLRGTRKESLIPYLRRYLNDVEPQTEIHIGLGDSNANNWKDGVS